MSGTNAWLRVLHSYIHSFERIPGRPEFLDQVPQQLDEADAAARSHRTVTREVLLTAGLYRPADHARSHPGWWTPSAVSRAREGLAYAGNSPHIACKSLSTRCSTPQSLQNASSTRNTARRDGHCSLTISRIPRDKFTGGMPW